MSNPIKPVLPVLTPWNRHYWTSGADGVLRMQRCASCGQIAHPPSPRCAVCLGELAVADLSGTGTVEGFTVNHQSWHPAHEPPYVIAIVAIDEDPTVRITTNIVNCDPDDVRIGLPVKVLFEQCDDVWLPLFEPDRTRVAQRTGPEWPSYDTRRGPSTFTKPTEKFESKVVISGIGISQVGRRLERDPLGLMIDACLAAIDDAGLSRHDIDGISSYPGYSFGGLSGASGGSVFTLEEVLRIRPKWFGSGLETSGQTGAVVNGMLAVHAGLCRHVVVVRGVWEATHTHMQRTGQLRPDGGGRVSGEMEWRMPYGAFSAANWIAMMANRHMHYFGTTREHLGAIALNARANAMLNPNAVYRDPLTMDDYLSARLVSTPFGLYDCDTPCDGAIAFVVSHVDTVPDLRQPIVGVEAVGLAMDERVSWDQGTLLHEPMVYGPSRHLWSRTDLKPGDVKVAELYDGFTFNCLSWIEALGFCGVGEAGSFLEGGRNIARDGILPLNTHGGQLSAGRTHGYGFLHEACLQLRGEGGERQVPNDPDVAVVSTGGGHPGGAWLLTKWR